MESGNMLTIYFVPHFYIQIYVQIENGEESICFFLFKINFFFVAGDVGDLHNYWENEDSLITESTALLKAAAATEIIITPMSPTGSSIDLSNIDSQEDTPTVADIHKMDLLKPDIIFSEDV